ncbi:MAG: polyprenyl synthetase family protein [Symbiobacteriaceae bacterium]|nr:polyprenyl synthetase family protein [Symbiobacteriaceae bacterium]
MTTIDELRQALDIFLQLHLAELETHPLLKEAMSYSLLARGKRVRGLLLLLTLDAHGASWQRGLHPAAAIEFIHCYSLIHDDLPCMDDDYLRRWLPTSHVKFGEGMAVLAGDALLTEAFGILYAGYRTQSYNGETLAQLLLQVSASAGATGMIRGQVEDILLQESSQPLKDDMRHRDKMLQSVREMHRGKTGEMILLPLMMACGILHLPEEAATLYRSFGYQLGKVYQIHDDLIDYLADPEITGKGRGRDQRHGKITYPSLLGVDQTQELLREEKHYLESLLKHLPGNQEQLALLLQSLF